MLAINSKDNEVAALAAGTSAEFINSHRDLRRYPSDVPVIFRSMSKKKLVDVCKQQQRDFYYIDTGYIGNHSARKSWHRIVKNNVQHASTRYDLPNDRFKRMCLGKPYMPFVSWKQGGRSILVVAPSEKPCKFYGVNKNEWITETVSKLSKHTDRPIVVREKPKLRKDRVRNNSIFGQFEQDDVFAVVTYNSIASVEAISYGIPAFTTAPNVADALCLKDLSLIETPLYEDTSKVKAWQNWLAYCQFSKKEMADGTAMQLIEKYSIR
jgi:hypothetical protein